MPIKLVKLTKPAKTVKPVKLVKLAKAVKPGKLVKQLQFLTTLALEFRCSVVWQDHKVLDRRSCGEPTGRGL